MILLFQYNQINGSGSSRIVDNRISVIGDNLALVVMPYRVYCAIPEFVNLR